MTSFSDRMADLHIDKHGVSTPSFQQTNTRTYEQTPEEFYKLQASRPLAIAYDEVFTKAPLQYPRPSSHSALSLLCMSPSQLPPPATPPFPASALPPAPLFLPALTAGRPSARRRTWANASAQPSGG